MTGDTRFCVKNQSGQIIGTYDANSKAEALDLMALDCGYRDYADYKRRCPSSDKAWWLTVKKVK